MLRRLSLGIITPFSDIYKFKIQAMATVEEMKCGLVEKILSINDKVVLEALDKFISKSSSGEVFLKLTEAQKKMLEMSEQDIKEGRLISQDAMMERNLEWLKGL